MYSYFNRNNFFYKLQFGFRKSYGTNHAVTKLVETVTDAFEQKEFVVGVFLDLSKTFDTINYNILFNKLHYYGIVATNQLARAKDLCDERRRCASMRENAYNDFR